MIHLQKQTEPQRAERSSKAGKCSWSFPHFLLILPQYLVLVTFWHCDQINTQEKQLKSSKDVFWLTVSEISVLCCPSSVVPGLYMVRQGACRRADSFDGWEAERLRWGIWRQGILFKNTPSVIYFPYLGLSTENPFRPQLCQWVDEIRAQKACKVAKVPLMWAFRKPLYIQGWKMLPKRDFLQLARHIILSSIL